eukprot:CAMPEP_0172732544 /NCGR_PEP_ID=MMETSP1074-20121228/104663_1 /TAXON_ID=2916 /ORGANISM="Ceratium fusus, Strain PA161109" /LENGTH=58 /DNA_ID=CAMNT_0013560865 /DNA_START=12 /DNA_END=185 /DNA_ORIENTATION=-
MEDRTEAYHIWNHTDVLHLAKPFFSLLDFATTSARVNHSIVAHDIGLNSQRRHSLEPS